MKNLQQLCEVRQSVFDKSRRDVTLDISDLIDDDIDADQFFAENFITDGMKSLYSAVFKRLEGNSDDGIFKLTQAMGGGKTHSMIAVGLLAKYPEYREKVMGHVYNTSFKGAAKVIGFTGRENPKYGIWGYIAEQLGKKDQFKEYYDPLEAPGQSAWINLLKGESIVILLDELPPYFQAAQAKQIGDGNLADITTQALSNLLVAIGKKELSNVSLVISDLSAAYSEGSEMIRQVMDNFESETNRLAKNFTPVQQNSDEIYHILRKRLFKNEFDENEVEEIADAYADAIREAKQMDISTETPEKFKSAVIDSFPFHPAIRDLYARFKENQGFMQTRGLIRLMRTIAAQMFNEDNGWADKRYLIAPDDIDLNDPDTLTEINSINSKLNNAISKDIADHGKALAEKLDAKFGHNLSTRTANLILMSSLATVQNAVRGLADAEIIRNLCRPETDISKIKTEVLEELKTNSWYLHMDNTGKFLYKNVQNVVAKLNDYVKGYNEESIRLEIKWQLEDLFQPQLKDCYQNVYVLPSIDEIEIAQQKVSLIIYRPHPGGDLHPDLQKLYEDNQYQNRMLFLTGDSHSLGSIFNNAANLKAAAAIIEEFKREKMATGDPQFVEAEKLQESFDHRFRSSVRETFVKLFYPTKNGLMSANFQMQFQGNNYNGEEQIKTTLEEKRKFTTDITSDSFVRQAESKLFFGDQKTPWSEILKRSATRPDWPWHKPDALEQLKEEMVRKDQWREEGSWVLKGPFPAPPTSVNVKQIARNDDTGEVTLKITPLHGDTVHYEIDSKATEASSKLDTSQPFKIKELKLSFLCVDSTGEHETGEPVPWKNNITLKYQFFGAGNDKRMELQVAPDATIKYTTDGSDPLNHGGIYEGPISVPDKVKYVLAIAEKKGLQSEKLTIPVPDDPSSVEIDKDKATIWKKRFKSDSTADTFKWLKSIRKHNIKLSEIHISVNGQHWVSLDFDESLILDYGKIEKTLEFIQTNLLDDGEVTIEAGRLHFDTGQQLIDYVEEEKVEYKADEIEQR
jgi:hypothetical protein